MRSLRMAPKTMDLEPQGDSSKLAAPLLRRELVAIGLEPEDKSRLADVAQVVTESEVPAGTEISSLGRTLQLIRKMSPRLSIRSRWRRRVTPVRAIVILTQPSSGADNDLDSGGTLSDFPDSNNVLGDWR
jgi:hypothetical protein